MMPKSTTTRVSSNPIRNIENSTSAPMAAPHCLLVQVAICYLPFAKKRLLVRRLPHPSRARPARRAPGGPFPGCPPPPFLPRRSGSLGGAFYTLHAHALPVEHPADVLPGARRNLGEVVRLWDCYRGVHAVGAGVGGGGGGGG